MATGVQDRPTDEAPVPVSVRTDEPIGTRTLTVLEGAASPRWFVATERTVPRLVLQAMPLDASVRFAPDRWASSRSARLIHPELVLTPMLG